MARSAPGRRAWLAGLLTLLSSAMGFAYVGRLGTGIVLTLLPFVVLALAGQAGLIQHPVVLWTLTGLALIAFVLLLVWVVRLAQTRHQLYRPRGYNRWYHYVWIGALGFAVSNAALAHRAQWFGYQTFRIPSTRREPTLTLGDFVLADTRASSLAHLRRQQVITYQPTRHPDQVWVARLIGLPGDEIAVDGHRVMLNGSAIAEPYLSRSMDNDSPGARMPASHVPRGQVFVMGDNRPNANDSRFTGPQPRSAVTGVVTAVWWAHDGSRIGVIAPPDR